MLLSIGCGRRNTDVFRCLVGSESVENLEVCSRSGRATFVGHCHTDGYDERDCSYRLSRGMELLDKFGYVLPFGQRELREAAVAELALPGMESCPEMSVEEAVELQEAGRSISVDFLGNNREINSSGRMCFSILSEQFGSGGDLTRLTPLWETL